MKTKRTLLWIIVGAIALPANLFAEEIAVVLPESLGLSSGRLQRITASVEELIQKEQLAGAVTLVARRGQVAYFEATGWQDKENRVPMEKDTIFRIASMTKPITSVAVMMLYEEGHFRLSNPIAKFIPEFSNSTVLNTEGETEGDTQVVNARRGITIHDLLTHTSGLTYQSDPLIGPKYYEAGITHGIIEDPGTIGDSIKKLAGVPLLHHPGERFTYGLSADVLGYFVEVVSGMPLDEFFNERIFQPLGMTDTSFFLNEPDITRLATVYAMGSNAKIVRETRPRITDGSWVYSTTYPFKGAKRYFSGGGGLCSTTADYYRFCKMLLNSGQSAGGRILGRKAVELMTSRHVAIDEDAASSYGFGLGFRIAPRPGLAHQLGSDGTYDWGGIFFTTFFIDPHEELIGISMAQLYPAKGLDWRKRFRTLVYQAIDD